MDMAAQPRKSHGWPVEGDAAAGTVGQDRVGDVIADFRDSDEVILFSAVAKRAGLQLRQVYENRVLTAAVRRAQDEQVAEGMGPDGWTILAVAAWLQVTRATVMRWIARGQVIASTDATGTLRIRKDHLDAWLDASRRRPARPEHPG